MEEKIILLFYIKISKKILLIHLVYKYIPKNTFGVKKSMKNKIRCTANNFN